MSIFGQERVNQISVFLLRLQSRNEPLDHVIFSGPLRPWQNNACRCFSEGWAQSFTTSGPAIERAGDLAAILTNLEEGDILFVDEIHRLNHQI